MHPTSRGPELPEDAPRSHDLVGRDNDSPALADLRALSRRVAATAPPPARYDLVTRLFWLLCLAAFVVGLWQLGPFVAERYQYAMSRGKMLAEYEQAREFLKSPQLLEISTAYESVARKIRPSVVSIKCARSVPGISQGLIVDGQGSGVIISEDGYIMTNAHVVMGASLIETTMYDRHTHTAQLIGIDPDTDLAVIKVSAKNLIPAEWGDSDRLQVGSLVWAIGSPYGLDQSVTSGIISGRNRYDRGANANTPHQELLQTDAAVNPGNSGGPLVNSNGNLVGINTSIVGEAFQGISFAVPSAVAKFVGEQLIKNGRVNRGFLGIVPSAVLPQHQADLNLPDLHGAILSSVETDSPAYRAGFRPGDVIRAWNGTQIDDYLLIYRMVSMTPPNSEATVDLIRNGRQQQLQITVGARPTAEEFDRRGRNR